MCVCITGQWIFALCFVSMESYVYHYFIGFHTASYFWSSFTLLLNSAYEGGVLYHPHCQCFLRKRNQFSGFLSLCFSLSKWAMKGKRLCLCTCERAHIQGKVFLNNLDYCVPHRAKQTAGNWLGSDWYVDSDLAAAPFFTPNLRACW